MSYSGEQLNVELSVEKDACFPHDPVLVSLAVQERGGAAKPVTGADVHLRVVWLGPHPQGEGFDPPEGLPQTYLTADPEQPGLYWTVFSAPEMRGNYALQVTVSGARGQEMEIRETITVR